tara:strand:- start:972 stop:1688 length:717 start_codon:yes stop_codon:yes gene_type:complete
MTKMYNCIIVDDEPLAVKVIKGYVDRTPQLALTGTCHSAMEAFHLVQNEVIDLIFLDIEMPELSGLDLAKSLPSSPKVIFTTAHRDYAIESYELDVVDYLLKPISFQRYFKSISKFLNHVDVKPENLGQSDESRTSQDSIYIYADKKNHKVYLNDILYLESLKDYVRIFMDNRNLVTKSTISNYVKLLPDNFLRIHLSFIVNKSKITAYTTQDVEIGNKELPIGVSFKKEVGEDLGKS